MKFGIGDVIIDKSATPKKFKILDIKDGNYYCLYLNKLEWNIKYLYEPHRLSDFYVLNKKQNHPLTRIFK
jgi:hypothetical protein